VRHTTEGCLARIKEESQSCQSIRLPGREERYRASPEAPPTCEDIILVILPANAIANPWTVMIHSQDADTTSFTMMSPFWAKFLALITIRRLSRFSPNFPCFPFLPFRLGPLSFLLLTKLFFFLWWRLRCLFRIRIILTVRLLPLLPWFASGSAWVGEGTRNVAPQCQEYQNTDSDHSPRWRVCPENIDITKKAESENHCTCRKL